MRQKRDVSGWGRRVGAMVLACVAASTGSRAWAVEGGQALAATESVAAQASVPTPVPAQALMPITAYARLPQVSSLSISPDGLRVAGLMNVEDKTLLFTQALTGQGKQTHVLVTDNKMFRFAWFRWASDERLVVSVSYPGRRDFVGTTETRLLSVRPDGKDLVNLVATPSFDRHGPSQIGDDVVDWLPEDGHHILLHLGVDGGIWPAVFKVNLDTGQREMVHPPKRNVFDWSTDANHRVRVAMVSDEGWQELRVCDPDGKNWRTLWRYQVFGADAVYPMGFGRDPQVLYVRANHEGRMAVFKVNLADADLKRELLLADPDVDINGSLIISPATGEVLGVRRDGRDSQRVELWDPRLRQLAQAIDKALPGQHNTLRSFSRDEQHYVVYAERNGQPGQFYVGNRQTGELAEMAETYPELAASRLVGKRQIHFKARDGLSLQGYLTQPLGVKGAAPLVLMPHGGPQSWDDDDFDVWTEFLANRGYAVLQVNFRGSAGVGHDFMKAGLGRWGLEMQDDLTDGVQWAVAQGVADPGRVCIVGFSYGGYAALMGAIKTPELYRCAVSVAGVTDLIDLWHHRNQYVGGAAVTDKQIGNAWDDRDRLKATSPTQQAARIKAPVLLMHGMRDRVVPVDQSRDMDTALKRANRPHQYIELEDGDHHLSRYADRLKVFETLEDFLAKNLVMQVKVSAILEP